jgi:hypothetical protein
MVRVRQSRREPVADFRAAWWTKSVKRMRLDQRLRILLKPPETQTLRAASPVARAQD